MAVGVTKIIAPSGLTVGVLETPTYRDCGGLAYKKAPSGLTVGVLETPTYRDCGGYENNSSPGQTVEVLANQPQ